MSDLTAGPTSDDPFSGTPYEDSPEGWWTELGGALNVASGVVFLPQGSKVPPCPFPCSICVRKGRQ